MRPVLLFDGECGFCTSAAHRLMGWSTGGLDVVPWQRADLEVLGVSPEQCAEAVQFVSQVGRSSGGAAIAESLRYCRQPGPAIGSLLRWWGIRWVREGVYRLVAANRHRLPSGTPACRLGE